MRIRTLRITPIAFRDPPLLNASGIHQPYALRTIIELETDDGHIGLGETYGGSRILQDLGRAREVVLGLDPFHTNTLFDRLAHHIRPVADEGLPLAPGTHGDKAFMRVFAALELACLDLQGQQLGKPLCDLLGGAVRDRVPYSAYLFYKQAVHNDAPYDTTDPWGEALSPEAVVAQARQMVAMYGFGSIKLKGGVFAPELEVDTIRQLKDAFPKHPLRLDPNAAWTVETSLKVGRALTGMLEYLEDPTPGLTGMAAVAREVAMPLATNMVVTRFQDFPKALELGSVAIILADHHYWGGLRLSHHLATLCQTWGLGLSMHSNSHLGISLAAMTHLAACTPNLSHACDTHYPWQDEEVIAGGRLRVEAGCALVPQGPGLGVTLDREALARLHQQYLTCGITDRDDRSEMKKYQPAWTGVLPRF